MKQLSMRTSILSVAFCLLLTVYCHSEEASKPKREFPVLKTTDGMELRDVTVTAIDQGGVSLMHSDGSGRFEWARILKSDQVAMGYDVDKIMAARAAAMEAAKQKEAQLQQDLIAMRAKRIPEIKASVATRKLSVSELAKALKEAQLLTGASFFETAKDIFGPPGQENKESYGEMSKFYGYAHSFTFFNLLYNSNTERHEWFNLRLYQNGAVTLEPQSGDGIILKER